MRVTAFDEYGLRCLLQIASAGSVTPRSATEIARAEGLSLPYANKLLHQLKRQGWIEAVRGARGGYRLLPGAENASLAAIMAGWDGRFYRADHCREYAGISQSCPHQAGSCAVRAVWRALSDQMQATLSRLTLRDLVEVQEEFLVRRLRGSARERGHGTRSGAAPPAASGER